MTRLNISGETTFITYKDVKGYNSKTGKREMQKEPVTHTYATMVEVDAEGAVTHALIIEKETDKSYWLVVGVPKTD